MSLAAPLGARMGDSTCPMTRTQATEQLAGDGPADRPNGSIDDDSVHPLTDPDDPTTGNVDPVVPVGDAPTDTETD